MIDEPHYKKVLNSDDVGTRLEHMMELQDLWSTTLGILTTKNTWHSELEKVGAKKLQIALDLLQHHMEAEYNLTMYAKEINELPKDAKEIPDDKKTE